MGVPTGKRDQNPSLQTGFHRTKSAFDRKHTCANQTYQIFIFDKKKSCD